MLQKSLCPLLQHTYKIILAYFWQLAHSAETTCTNVHIARLAIHLDAAALHVEYKTTTGAMLRKRYVIAIQWLALTNVTTTC